MNTSDAIRAFGNSDRLIEFLETDICGTSEVGATMNKDGDINNIKLGKTDAVSMDIPSGQDIIGIHTHPSVSGVKISEGDMKSTNYPNIVCSIILCQEMFDTTWDGICFKCENMSVVEKNRFRVEAEGSTDGPKSQRYISDANIEIL